MKVFISQPMKDKTSEEILETRNEIIKYITEKYGENVEVIESYFGDAPKEARPLWYLGKSIMLLSEADLAVFAEGWGSSRGCVIEHDCAREYGITRYYMNTTKI